MIIIGLLLMFGDLGRITDVLTRVHPSFLLLGVMGIITDRLLMAYRWWILSEASGYAIPYWHLLRVYVVSGFFGTFLPSSVGADLVSMAGLSRYTGSKITSASLVLVDRVAGLFSLFLVAAFAAALAVFYPIIPVQASWILAVAIFFGVGCLAIGISFHPAIHRLAEIMASYLPWKAGKPLQEIYDAYRQFGRRPMMLLGIVGIAMGNHIISHGVVYLLSRSLGLEVPFLFYLIVMPLVTVLLMLPISLGGLGVQEGALAFLLSLAGVPVVNGVGLALLIRLAWTAMTLPGGVLYAIGGFSISGQPEASLSTHCPLLPKGIQGEGSAEMAMRFIKKYPNLTAFALGLMFTGFVVLTCEIGLGMRVEPGRGYNRTSVPGGFNIYKERDSSGSARPPASGTYRVHSVDKGTGELIYDVTYKIDDRRRRITPVETRPSRDKHALFFADSFAYGEGVQENETLEYYVGALAPRYMPYNYGFHSGSALEMLAKLESGELPDEVPEKKGVLIYLYIDDHIFRTIGTMRYTMWDVHRPYYSITDEGKVVRDGDLTSGRSWLTGLYMLLGKSEILKYFDVDFPPRVTDRHVKFLAQLLQEARKLYVQQFPGSEFYVLLYPRARKFGPTLCSYLQEMKIVCLDYTDLIPANDRKKYKLPVDGHPNAQAYELLARRVVADLKLTNKDSQVIGQGVNKTGIIGVRQ